MADETPTPKEERIPVISPEGKHGSVPRSKFEQALKEGFQEAVRVKDTDGVAGSIPVSKVAEAYKAGYTPILPEGRKTEKSLGESILRGATQGLTMGFGDELSAAGNVLYDKATGQGEGKSIGELYHKWRDTDRKANAEASQDHPTAYGASQAGGALASGLALPTGGTGVLGQVGAGALQGGVAALGGSQASGLDLAKDTLKGAAVGGALGGAAGLVGKGLEGVKNALPGIANKAAARAIGVERGSIRKLGGPEAVNQLGRDALDQGVFQGKGAFSDAEKIKEVSENLQKVGGAKMEQAFKAVGQPTANGKALAGDFMKSLDDSTSYAINDNLKPVIEKIASDLNNGGDQMSIQALQKLKQQLGNKAYPTNSTKVAMNDADATARGVYMNAYNLVNNAIDDTYQNAMAQLVKEGQATPQMLTLLQEGKKQFGTGAKMEQLINNRLNREWGNKRVGLTDTITGAGVGGALGMIGHSGPVGALLGGASIAVKHGLEKYGNSVGAAATHAVEQAIPKMGRYAAPLADAAKRGGNALAVSHFLLSQSDPEYRKKYQEAVEGTNERPKPIE